MQKKSLNPKMYVGIQILLASQKVYINDKSF